MMKTLINIYWAIIGRIPFLKDRALKRWLTEIEHEHANLSYFIKKQIITNNLFGVDIMEEATEIARLRLFLALVASAETVDELEPLPNIDFNILAGNSLLGLMQVEAQEFDNKQDDLFRKSYSQILSEKNAMIRAYRDATTYAEDLQKLRDDIDAHKQQAKSVLDEILLDEFNRLKIKFEQATWDDKKNKAGKSVWRSLQLTDFADLHLFHWGYEFDEILNLKGGFDAIITNPPWEVFQTDEKEFFGKYSDIITKKKMSITEFTKKRNEFLKDSEIQNAWLKYSSQFPHQNSYFKKASQYKNQTSIVKGKKVPSKNNLFKLFIEQCFNLLCAGGRCGIILPTSIYIDAGNKQLREMLFYHAKIDALFGISNERFIFEGIDHRFKLCILTWEKGGKTDSFMSAFRMDPREAIKPSNLLTFLNNKKEQVEISIDLIHRLSPDYLSVMEIKTEIDVKIIEKMSVFPRIDEIMPDEWNLRFSTEFDKTATKGLFENSRTDKNIPLYNGGMIHHFTHQFAQAKYYIDAKNGRKLLTKKMGNSEQNCACDDYRFITHKFTNQ